MHLPFEGKRGLAAQRAQAAGVVNDLHEPRLGGGRLVALPAQSPVLLVHLRSTTWFLRPFGHSSKLWHTDDIDIKPCFLHACSKNCAEEAVISAFGSG